MAVNTSPPPVSSPVLGVSLCAPGRHRVRQGPGPSPGIPTAQNVRVGGEPPPRARVSVPLCPGLCSAAAKSARRRDEARQPPGQTRGETSWTSARSALRDTEPARQPPGPRGLGSGGLLLACPGKDAELHLPRGRARPPARSAPRKGGRERRPPRPRGLPPLRETAGAVCRDAPRLPRWPWSPVPLTAGPCPALSPGPSPTGRGTRVPTWGSPVPRPHLS